MGDFMKNKKKKRLFFQTLEFPEDIGNGSFHVEVFDSSVTVDGCRSVAEYSDGIIRLNTCGALVSIKGENLGVKSFASSQATVNGKILSVEFERRTV